MKRAHLENVARKLAQGFALTPQERTALARALDRALAGDPDPFGLAKKRGGQPRSKRHREIAETVARLHWDEGHSLESACELAGERHGCSGANHGTAARAFEKHRYAIESWRLTFGTDRPLTPEEEERLDRAIARVWGH